MERLIFVDSNIWCYYFDRSAQEHEAVSERLEGVLEGGVAINTVVAMEVAHYLIKSLGSKGKRKMDIFLSYPMEIIDFDQNLARKSVEYLAKYSQTGIGGRDATILASMEELGTRKLMTHDRAFKRLDFIEVVDPVS
ncbi:MAG: tRNA(fMet)-specific endonuclease VapC [Methanosaeta sp. PtaB.Bin018]|jgi:predicted nucleic acid-binding protein|nr:type II toxin-antitoxin system VapC family toxin [Methanothrix sp.]OPX76446.1 MAG: tRNA(fMet)-specific endonuclease VapC [Methanosaeta sp. PtaB.Bin018]OPY44236.1 MAG: tRNA(fMet)-specific endonuclease VapC [Methanosaeta sp. PtaU1.Bin016]HOV51533.1 type II toxin-antitoxin system VapC family toxin [Methanothrix sp.]